MEDGKAVIDQKYIKRGKCLDICPQKAIRLNSESPVLRNAHSETMEENEEK